VLAQWLLDPVHLRGLLNWRSTVQLLITVALPIVLLARMRVRRLPWVSLLFLNGVLLALAGGLLFLMEPWAAHSLGSPLDWR
jgi:hypothetical protein